MPQYPIILEVLSGVVLGFLVTFVMRYPTGQICLIASLLGLMVVRIAQCGGAQMTFVLNHLLGDIAQTLLWTINHQGFTLGLTMGVAFGRLVTRSSVARSVRSN